MAVLRPVLIGLGFVLVLVALTAEVKAGDWYFEVGAGLNTNLTGASIPWDDAGELGAYFGLRYEHEVGEGVQLFLQGAHFSQWLAGPPFDSRRESSMDHIGFGIRFQL